jgi:hypothetical protein
MPRGCGELIGHTASHIGSPHDALESPALPPCPGIVHLPDRLI